MTRGRDLFLLVFATAAMSHAAQAQAGGAPPADGVRVPPPNALGASADASAPPQYGRPGARFAGPPNRFGGQPPVGGPRQQLEQRLRMRFEQVVRQRLQLTDAQVAQLRATNQRFVPQRRALAAAERDIRQSMRRELQPGGAVNEQRVSKLTDSLFALQHARLNMLQSEQRELGTFLTPSQRLRYYALQEQLRRRVEVLRAGVRTDGVKN